MIKLLFCTLIALCSIVEGNMVETKEIKSESDLKANDAIEMIRVTILSPEQIDGLLMSMTQQAIIVSKQDIEASQVVASVKEQILNADFLKKFAPIFEKNFTQEEMKSIVAFYQSDAMKKFFKTSSETLIPVYTAIQQVVSDTVKPPSEENKALPDKVTPISGLTYQKEVIESKDCAVLEIYSTFCAPCQVLAPIFSELSRELDEVKFMKLNLDSEQKLAKELEIYSVPTLLLIKNGKVIDRQVGLIDKEKLKARIKEKLL
jgi:thioredoxin 1